MNYDEINFHKINRRPVTDTTYQIAAEEWNALGAKVSEMDEAIEDIGATPLCISPFATTNPYS